MLYLKTKFSRFLMLQAMTSIMISKDSFRFVPLQDFSRPWTDADLYAKYGLTDDEIAFIESMIKPME
jgi:site-specific DNA-methyltransferase (adenine-specific)